MSKKLSTNLLLLRDPYKKLSTTMDLWIYFSVFGSLEYFVATSFGHYFEIQITLKEI